MSSLKLFQSGIDQRGHNKNNETGLFSYQCIQGRSCGSQGFEIGFHPGYDTFNDPERLAEEKDRLDAVLGKTQYGGRQHFLRFQVPNTWRHWEQIGLTYDSTMTYADHEGFRCGTCHPFRPFDVEQNRELDLWEWPLIVMDGTLRQYRGLTPEQGQARILELARRCKQVGGTFTLLWHNSSLGGEWRPWAEVYRRVVGVLAEMQGDVHSEVGTGEWTDGRCFRVAVAQFVAGWGMGTLGRVVSADGKDVGGDVVGYVAWKLARRCKQMSGIGIKSIAR